MGLLDGGGARLFNAVFDRLYLPADIISVSTSYNQVGESTETETVLSGRVQVDVMTESMRAQEGASDQDRRIIVSSGNDMAVDTDAVIAVNAGPYAGSKWLVMAVERDPVSAYFQCRARRRPS